MSKSSEEHIGLPNFLVIGAARSGTTTLYEFLKRHPGVFLPENKRPEPHFFLKGAEYEKGLDYYKSTYFSTVSDQKMIGEISTSYLFSKKSADRIYKYNPNTKLVAILRNPVDRAFSNYWHSVRNGIENESFEFAVENEPTRHDSLSEYWKEIAPFAYLGRSSYADQIKYYLDLFGRKQMHFIVFEDFIQDTQNVMNDLIGFLGLDSNNFDLGELTTHNKSTPEGENLNPKTRKQLLDYFRASNNIVADLIGRDLSKWNL